MSNMNNEEIAKNLIKKYKNYEKCGLTKDMGFSQFMLYYAGIDLEYIYKEYSLDKISKDFFSTKLALYLYWRLYATFCNEHYTHKSFVAKTARKLLNRPPEKDFLSLLEANSKNKAKRDFKNNMLFEFRRQINSYSKNNSRMQYKTLDKANKRSRTPILGYQYAYYKFHFLMTLDIQDETNISYRELISSFKAEISTLPNGKKFCSDSIAWHKLVKSYKIIHNFAVNHKHRKNLPPNFNEIVQLLYNYVFKYTKENTEHDNNNNYAILNTIPALYELERIYFYYSSCLETIYSQDNLKYTSENKYAQNERLYFEMYDDLELYVLSLLQHMPDEKLKALYDSLSIISFYFKITLFKKNNRPLSITEKEWSEKREVFIPSYEKMGVEYIKSILNISLLFQERPSTYDIDLFLIQATYLFNNTVLVDTSDYEQIRKKYIKVAEIVNVQNDLEEIISSKELSFDEKLLCRYVIFITHVQYNIVKYNRSQPEFNTSDIHSFDVESENSSPPILDRKTNIENDLKKYSKIFIQEIMNLLYHHYSNATIWNDYDDRSIYCPFYKELFIKKRALINLLEHVRTHRKNLYDEIEEILKI